MKITDRNRQDIETALDVLWLALAGHNHWWSAAERHPNDLVTAAES